LDDWFTASNLNSNLVRHGQFPTFTTGSVAVGNIVTTSVDARRHSRLRPERRLVIPLKAKPDLLNH